MSMSKQDFVALADAIRNHNKSTVGQVEPFTEEHIATLILFCRGQNSAFMPGRWRDYIDGKCGPNGGAVKKGKV